jgi:hypothetical protein
MKTMKYLAFALIMAALLSCTENKASEQKEETIAQTHDHNAMMQEMKHSEDQRISLDLPPMKARHQLMNMRSHLLAVQNIIDHLSKDEFEKASKIASSQLGLTEEMKMMCSSFGNDQFESLGLGFHKSADKMAELFKAKNKANSLMALSNTLNYCVECHAKFRQ